MASIQLAKLGFVIEIRTETEWFHLSKNDTPKKVFPELVNNNINPFKRRRSPKIMQNFKILVAAVLFACLVEKGIIYLYLCFGGIFIETKLQQSSIIIFFCQFINPYHPKCSTISDGNQLLCLQYDRFQLSVPMWRMVRTLWHARYSAPAMFRSTRSQVLRQAYWSLRR